MGRPLLLSLWGEDGLLNWWRLRSVGNLGVLKVSYIALAATPFLTKFKVIGKFLNLYDTYIILAAFFGGILLGSANLLYDLFCPTIIKRFDSPNSFYKEMLQIKELSMKMYPYDRFQASLIHCSEGYRQRAFSRRFVGICCGLLFIASGICFIFIILDRIVTVVSNFSRGVG